MTINFYSNNYQKEPYTILDKLLEVAKRSCAITILSAYYDAPLLRKILDVIPRKNRRSTNILFIFNQLAGYRLDNQRQELTKVKEHLFNNGFKEVDIRLISHKAIFHTKLYKFQVGNWHHWFIGSANATEAAFGQNEEILIHFKGGNSELVNYIAEVKQKSKTIEEGGENNSSSSLISFLRDGMLYFRPRNQIRFNYDALSDQKEDIKKYFRTLSEPIRFSEPGKPFGPFSIKKAVDIEEIITDDSEEKKKGEVAVIVPYSIETSLGYWVPTKYIDFLKDRIEKSEKNQLKNFKNIRTKIKKMGGKANLINKFNAHIDDIENILKKNKKKFNSKNIKEKFEKFIDGYLAKVNDDSFLKRNSRKFIPMSVPEIWNDREAYDEFLESFVEYISYCVSLSRKPNIIKILLNNMHYESNDSADDIREKTIDYFKNHNWESDFWE